LETQLQFDAELNEAIPPLAAEFTTTGRVDAMIKLCDSVERHPNAHAGDRINYKKMVAWAVEMQAHSVTQEILDGTQILIRLKNFLKPANPDQHSQKHTPLNLLEELTFILNKWTRGDLSADANRGLLLALPTTDGGTSSARLRIDETWPHRRHDNHFGHGELINGQKFRTRIEISREGGHGPLIAGIAGSVKHGARSIVMGLHNESKREYYADIDRKDKIYYVGTALPENKDSTEPTATNIKDTAASRNQRGLDPTHHTQMLLRSIETQRPVRVFRSYNLAKIVKHKPVKGYRYDGLYGVVRAKLLKKDRQIYRFTMKRLRRDHPDAGGQGPLRGVHLQGT
jgi:hypothetical protein